MRFIKQENGTSCGIACVAMLAEKVLHHAPPPKRHMIVINKAKELFKRDFIKKDSYTTRDEIKKLLKAFKVSFRERFNPIGQNSQSQKKFWRALEGVNLVAVRFRTKDRTEYWHWIIAVQTKNGLKIYDPNPKKGKSLIDLTKKDLPNQGSYKNAKWYLKIV